MATKPASAGGIPERRVRPVWDAIDSRQFKIALKHVTPLISKYPHSPYALALKALILERMGKTDEAFSVCVIAKDLLYANDSICMDDYTLSTLQMVFQRLDHLDLATSCYEYACGKFPNNFDLMTGLFNCYVREYSFVKQQQIAIKMYKLAFEERFLLWAVCSIQLQVLYGDGGEKLLLLAEGLLKKHIASYSLHEPEALMVYISILEQQAKYGDALEILSGNLGSLLTIEVDRLRIQGRLLARAGDYAEAANIFQRILELCPDDWECFLHYLGCLLEDDSNWCDRVINNPVHRPKCVQCKISSLADEVFDSRMSNASDFVRKLQADASNTFLRSPYLANLEIERRKHIHGKGNDDKLLESLIQYYIRFGHLACFTSDVEMFLEVLTADNKTELLEKLKNSIDSSSTIQTKLLGLSITYFKLQELVGYMFQLPLDELKGCAVQMVKMYCENLPLSKDLDPQESIHGEELLSLACNVLVQLFWRTRHFGYIVEAIMVLEFGLTIRRYASQYKILLLHLYSLLGTLSTAYEWYKLLDVKNILMETVSHHILPQMLVSPLWVDLNNLLKDYLKFMDDHFRESADLTFLAYRHRNYSKVIEFIQFKERLQHSNQYLIARMEASILQLKQHADNLEEEEGILENLKCGADFIELSNEIGSKSLTFNEDLLSRPWWTPTSEKNYLLVSQQRRHKCCFLEACVRFVYVVRKVVELIEVLLKKSPIIQERILYGTPVLHNWNFHRLEMEAKVRRVLERKSLLPRLIHLSIQSASAAVKESIKANGSLSDPKISSELRFLLDCYAKMLGLSLNDAVELVMGVSSGLKSYEDFGSDLIDWLNFAVFFNAWNLSWGSHAKQESDRCWPPNTWHIVDSLLEKFTLANVRMTEYLNFPSSNLPLFVQLVTEPLGWHGLVIQSCVRSSLPSGKKKKKTGSSDQSASPLSLAVRESIHCLSSIVEEVMKWSRTQISRSDEENLEAILSSVRKEENNEGAGQVFEILETFASAINNTDLGDAITEALKSWNSFEVARKTATGKNTVLSEFLKICESKFKSFQSLAQLLSQV